MKNGKKYFLDYILGDEYIKMESSSKNWTK